MGLLPFQLVAIIVAAFALSRVILRLKEKKITIKEFIFWAVIWIVILVISSIPRIPDFFSSRFGIERGADFLIYLSIILLFYLLFRMYVKVEQMEQNITEVVRHVAIQEKKKKRK